MAGRSIEIISEVHGHLSDALKARHAEIPWSKVAGIRNVLRHDCERIAPDVIWKLVRDDLPPLEEVCRWALWLNRKIGSSELDGGPERRRKNLSTLSTFGSFE
jgi:uncharacterized protein with HEPN domain